MMKNSMASITRLQELQLAIKQKCFNCSMDVWADVADCNIKACPLYNVRPTAGFGGIKEMEEAIRRYCLDCTGDSIGGVRGCPTENCHLYGYRL